MNLHEKHRQQIETRKLSASIVLAEIRKHIEFSSVLDVGCGVGAWLAAAEEVGATDIHGIDGPWVDTKLLAFEPKCFQVADLNAPFELDRKFDLAVSIEVGEHLKREASTDLVRSLTKHAPVVMFSAAIPGQGGSGHINEAWPRFWVAQFAKQGFGAYDLIRKTIWGDERVAPWVQQNGILFIKEGASVSPELSSYRIAGEAPVMVHGVTYKRVLRKIASLEVELSNAQAQPPSQKEASPAPSSPNAASTNQIDQLPAEAVIDVLVDRLAHDAPCSLVRLSHCEAKFLTGSNELRRIEFNRSLKRQFGYTDVSEQDIIDISAGVRAAALGSDILGVPVLNKSDMERLEAGDDGMRLWSLVLPALDRYRLVRADTLFASQNIHLRLMESDFIDRVLKVTKKLTIVGCRDLRSQFESMGFEELDYIPVPEAARTRDKEVAVKRHYPDAFAEIVARIRRERQRGLFLVGAGFLGKAYCHEIRLAGGVAVDVGSVMDVWAGVASRTGYENVVPRFSLKLEGTAPVE